MFRRLTDLLRRRHHYQHIRSGQAPQDAPDVLARADAIANADPMPADFADAGKQVFGDRDKRGNRRESW